MLLLTLVFQDDLEDIVDGINKIKGYFKNQNSNLGISESIEAGHHMIKIYCEEEECTKKIQERLNYYIADIIYKAVTNYYIKTEMEDFILDTYFFLKTDELVEIRTMGIEALYCNQPIADENSIYCFNKKNSSISKIIDCMKESRQININGYITFRMKELVEDFESIVDNVVEKYMVEKEYSEFIKLLKYFVEIQEVKIDEVNLVIEKDGNYSILDKEGIDIYSRLLKEMSITKPSHTANKEDILISGLITNSPGKIKIHHMENCQNMQFLDTIKNVFQDRVTYCNNCKFCRLTKSTIKI